MDARRWRRAIGAAALGGLFALACSGPSATATTDPAATGGGDTPAEATAERPYTSADWWPNRLDLRGLSANAPSGDPTDADFDYAEEFAKVDLAQLKKDIEEVLTTSQDWWPADHGHYGGLMIRLAWHSAGTYRISDGRGALGVGQHPVRAAQQLARQRQPRQGAPAALAGQEEVRATRVVGRPDRAVGERRARIDGLRDVRLRRWP
jgi:hypothetical protein